MGCKNCFLYKHCKDSAVSWVFLFIGLVATISVRLVPIVSSFGMFWPKFFWYVGISGFLLYFYYKFRQDKSIQRVLKETKLIERIVLGSQLTEQDRQFLLAAICKLRSQKDAINYFFIFSSSFIALIIAIYQDFVSS
ncbi:MAG: hypothetical protein N2606_04470 [Candidatus Omnitrophica bacterium]|nr:hypothetical protein [Candidatus Omnitrophota bacterium]